MSTNQVCTFFLDDLTFGVEVSFVQEVLPLQDVTPVPMASDGILGLINLRGMIVLAIDLRRPLSLPPRNPTREMPPANIVLRGSGEGPVSLLVDEIGDVIDVDASAFEPIPDTLRGVAREFLRGVYKLEGKLLLVLDANRLLQI